MAAISKVVLSTRKMVVLAILAASGMACYYLAIFLPNTQPTNAHPTIGRHLFGNDFYQVWLTSRECVLQRVDPYSPTITHQLQRSLLGHELDSDNPNHLPADYRAFPYPAFVDIFGLPVSWLQFSKARVVLLVVLVSLVILSVRLWSKRFWKNGNFPLLFVVIVLTLSSYQGLEALYDLQPGLIVGFLLAATIAALAENRLRLAGTLLALTTIKPQVSSLVIFYLLLWVAASWQERWKFVLSFLFTLTALCSAALLVWPGWIFHWLQAVTKYPGYYGWPPLLDIFGPSLGKVMLALILAAVIRFAWSNRHEHASSSRFALTVGSLLAITTITILPEHAVYDQLILLPGMMAVACWCRIIWERNAICKGVLVLAVGALCWQWIAAPIVLLVWATAPRLASTILFLPLRTALAIPFVTVALLFLIIWQGKERTTLIVANR